MATKSCENTSIYDSLAFCPGQTVLPGVRNKVWVSPKKNIVGWNKFHKEIEYRAGVGFFVGLDGRKVPLKSAHFGMSSYLQAGEAVIMKRAMVESYKKIKELGLDAFQVAVVHDEMQWDCAEDCAETVGEILRQNIIDAGAYYKLRCPLDGEYRIGNNWLETH